VPLEFRNTIIERMMKIGSVRSVADHIVTDTGVNLPWPTLDDTGNEGAILAENSQVAQQDLVFGTNSLDAYMYTSKLVLVSLQLLNDAGFDVEHEAADLAGQPPRPRPEPALHRRHRLVAARRHRHQRDGRQDRRDGPGHLGDLRRLHRPDRLDRRRVPRRRQRQVDARPERCARSSARSRTARGGPLWEPSLQAGTPDSLLSYPIVLNNHMPVPAASAKPLLFGDFEQGYIVRDVSDVQVCA
jgi:hypothetical protein